MGSEGVLIKENYPVKHKRLHRFIVQGALASLCGVALSGCVTSRSVYTASGQQGYEVTCNGKINSWNDCLAKAGDLCKARGYTVLEKNGEQLPFAFNSTNADDNVKAKLFAYQEDKSYSSFSAAGVSVHRSILVACGRKE